jgi:hypothetical protein
LRKYFKSLQNSAKDSATSIDIVEDKENQDLRWLSTVETCSSWGGITHNNNARWAKSLLEGGENLENINAEERCEWLSRISIVNLKKLAGDKAANYREIIEYAKNDHVYIWEQLCIYKPDIIVACGDPVNWLLWTEVLLKMQPTDKYRKWELGHTYNTQFPNKDTVTAVICWRHPNRAPTELFYKLSEIARSLMSHK